MDHWLILLMLLTTIQPLSATATSCKKEITIQSCPKAWIIKDNKINGKDVLTVACGPRFKNNFKLVLRALPRDCSWPNAGTYPCLEVVVKGNTYKMCKICCQKHSCSAPNFCKDCKERKELFFNLTDSPVKIEIKDSTCELSETESTFDETSSSLQLFNETKSWIEALNYCDQLSFSLVEITNQTVWDELKNILVNKAELQKGVWVGLERSIFGTNIKWQWTSGAKAEQPEWISSFPANGLNNHCGKIVWSNQSNNIQLLDANCHDELPFICQDTTVMPEN
ncbi:uncharacterized protein LOC111612012 [Xiphophorus maculatus]|uniref:uncharacterized protein LOC111612012 n=1 Tax=Xiphophorus maculatus TaxID=8083 RepID=UPI000C6CDAB7|nr:uncharacterized protein LOC111612012 [Xiphophorus maculatus]